MRQSITGFLGHSAFSPRALVGLITRRSQVQILSTHPCPSKQGMDLEALLDGLLADPVAVALLLGEVTQREAVEAWERADNRLRQMNVLGKLPPEVREG